MMKNLHHLFGSSFFMRTGRSIGILILFLFASFRVSALVYVVTTTNDTHALLPGTGTGLDGSGNISLRSALEDADALGGVHTIILGTNTYTLTLGQITFGNVAENITITGNGATATIVDMTLGATRDRIFFINPSGATDNVELRVTGVTFRNGFLTTDPYGGAAICAGGGAGNSLSLTNCAFINNTVPLGNGTGGAINQVISGDLTVNNCTFSNNHDNDADGGAIYFLVVTDPAYAGHLIVNGSTFTGNTVSNGASGGAISFSATGDVDAGSFSVSIQKNTFLNNTASTGFGGAIAGNTSYGPNGIADINYNRFKGNTSSFSAAGAVARFGGSNGTINATNNWWACNTGPVGIGCDRAATVGPPVPGALITSPFLQLKASAPDIFECPGEHNTTTVTASFLSNSANAPVSPSDLTVLIGQPISFVNPVLGTLSGADPVIQPSGTASVTFTSNGTLGVASVNAVVDNVPNNDPVAKAEFNVTGDNTPPTITCPGPVTVQCASMVPATNTASVTATDNTTPNPTITFEGDVVSNQTCTNRFTVTRTYRATDDCGNSSTCTQTITVNDNTPPTITCPPPVTVECASSVPPHDFGGGSASDNCAGIPTVTWVSDNISGMTCANNYTLTREYKATDECGNESRCTQTITVSDNTAPTIDCPPAVTVQCASAVPAHDFAGGSVNDNCGTVNVTWVSDIISNPGCVNKYTITRTYVATDACGHTATCVQTITVNDDTAPVINCPASLTVQCASAVPAHDFAGGSASDNCAGSPLVTWVSDVVSDQTCANRFTVTRTYRAIDACGNSSTCTQTITVNDNTAPTLTCPAAVTVQCSSAVPAHDFADGSASDNCAGTPTVSWVSDVVSNQSCANRFTITRTYSATDECGNVATCTQTITVNDNTAPTITCPAAVTVQCASAVPAYDFAGGSASDNCGSANVTWVSDVISNQTCANRFTVTRTYRATDACGNFTDCAQTITVNDNTPPVLNCSNVEANPTSMSGAVVNYTPPTATDNCGSVTVTYESGGAPGSTFPIGVTIVTYKATDACGNESTCTFTVTVNNPSCDENKVYVCHNGHTICISVNALQTHLRHGDQLGPCSWYPGARMLTTEEKAPEVYQVTNFPNPFRNETIIRFDLPVNSKVSIAVFDVMGKQVVNVLSSERKAGVYYEEFSAENLPAGIYYYKFVAVAQGKQFIQTLKLSVVK